MIRIRPLNCLLALAALPLAACQTAEGGTSVASVSAPALEPAPKPVRAKNVILFIGDGMGISTITAARIYEGQKRGRLAKRTF